MAITTSLIQQRLTTTLTKLPFNRTVVSQIIASNDHASDAVLVKAFLIPSAASKKGSADAKHLLWIKSVAAQTTEIFEPRGGVLFPDTFELHISASADDKVTLTVAS